MLPNVTLFHIHCNIIEVKIRSYDKNDIAEYIQRYVLEHYLLSKRFKPKASNNTTK